MLMLAQTILFWSLHIFHFHNYNSMLVIYFLEFSIESAIYFFQSYGWIIEFFYLSYEYVFDPVFIQKVSRYLKSRRCVNRVDIIHPSIDSIDSFVRSLILIRSFIHALVSSFIHLSINLIHSFTSMIHFIDSLIN